MLRVVESQGPRLPRIHGFLAQRYQRVRLVVAAEVQPEFLDEDALRDLVFFGRDVTEPLRGVCPRLISVQRISEFRVWTTGHGCFDGPAGKEQMLAFLPNIYE